jgi:tetratricopeptide (TPR) repeat protein
MQYYGTPEFAGEAEPEAGDGHKHGALCQHGENFGCGKYPLFLAMSRHVLELDPGFISAGLYGAGSLAFNMGRASEAEELLAYGLRYNPREWKYLKVLAAVGYSRSKDPVAVAEQLQPILKDPDCPVMLKQLAAFLNKKAGNYKTAAAIYEDILATSHDPAYVRNARRELALLARRAGG